MSIEGMGYTEDGMAWLAIAVNVNGQRGRAVVTLTPEEAEYASEQLKIAATNARKYQTMDGGIVDERDSQHTH